MDDKSIDTNNIKDPQQESHACRLHNNSGLTSLNPFSTSTPTPRQELKRRRSTPHQPSLEAPEAATTLEAPAPAPEEVKAAKDEDEDGGDDDGLNDESNLSEHVKTLSTPFLDVRIDGPEARIVNIDATHLNINAMKPSEQTELELHITVKYIKEFCKPGGGILTMDFCTLGMSFTGECSDLIRKSLHQTKNAEKRGSLLEFQLLTL